MNRVMCSYRYNVKTAQFYEEKNELNGLDCEIATAIAFCFTTP